MARKFLAKCEVMEGECKEVNEGVCFAFLHFHLIFFVQNLTILQGMLSGGDDGLGMVFWQITTG